jgi:hypothetical protein
VDQTLALRDSQISAADLGVDVFADADAGSSVRQTVDLSAGTRIRAPIPVVVDSGFGGGTVTQDVSGP